MAGELKVEDSSWKDEVLRFRYRITSYGADIPIDALLHRLKEGEIRIPQEFQRGFIWPVVNCHRFIESILLGIPTPGIFLAEEKDGRLLVLDGQQRLLTLQAFRSGLLKDKPFVLAGVQRQFLGQTYESLLREDKRRFTNTIIHATVVRQDEPSDDQSSIYVVFSRLNTGGIVLQPQEVRRALYHGPFSDLLAKLNENGDWRALIGPVSKRYKDQELILRFFALFHDGTKYERPMTEFLNTFMGRHRSLKYVEGSELASLFGRTVAAVNGAIGSRAFRLKSAVNAALTDAVMVGIGTRVERKGVSRSGSSLRAAYEHLIGNADFVRACSRATSDEESVRLRLELAIAAFKHA